jgi:hypothetical protein
MDLNTPATSTRSTHWHTAPHVISFLRPFFPSDHGWQPRQALNSSASMTTTTPPPGLPLHCQQPAHWPCRQQQDKPASCHHLHLFHLRYDFLSAARHLPACGITASTSMRAILPLRPQRVARACASVRSAPPSLRERGLLVTGVEPYWLRASHVLSMLGC